MVNIPIKNTHSIKLMLVDSVSGCDGNIVKQTKSHCAIFFCMMPRWAHQGESTPFAGLHACQCGQGRVRSSGGSFPCAPGDRSARVHRIEAQATIDGVGNPLRKPPHRPIERQRIDIPPNRNPFLPHRPQEIEIVLGVNALKRLKPVGNGGDDLSNPRIPNLLEDKPRPLGFLEAGN